MVEALEAVERKKRKPGRPSRLSLPDQLLVTLQYHYDYRTQLQLGVESGLGESAICRLIAHAEDHSGTPAPEPEQLSRIGPPGIAPQARYQTPPTIAYSPLGNLR